MSIDSAALHSESVAGLTGRDRWLLGEVLENLKNSVKGMGWMWLFN